MGSDGAGEPEPGQDCTDRPIRFCPRCGAPLSARSFVQEYWTAQIRVFHCWCVTCDFVGDVTPTERLVTHEPAHDD